MKNMEFALVALGGTFDIIHAGHMALLDKGFSISKKVILGLTSDELAEKKGKKLLNSFHIRYSRLDSLLKEHMSSVFEKVIKTCSDAEEFMNYHERDHVIRVVRDHFSIETRKSLLQEDDFGIRLVHKTFSDELTKYRKLK